MHSRPSNAAPIIDLSQNEQLIHRCHFDVRILAEDHRSKLPTTSGGSSITNAIIFDVLMARFPSSEQQQQSTLIVFTTSIIYATTVIDFKRMAAFIIAH